MITKGTNEERRVKVVSKFIKDTFAVFWDVENTYRLSEYDTTNVAHEIL